MIEVTGNESKVEKMITLLKVFGITDLTRTGTVALHRKSRAEQASNREA